MTGWEGTVEDADTVENTLTTSAGLPADGRLERLPSGEYKYTGTAAADIRPPAGARLLPAKVR